jgi:general secretion pathway protein D
MEDTYSANVDKIPVLGDVPYVGSLFKSENRSRKKTNLMVFLRPVVLRDAMAAETFTMDRYDLMRGTQQDGQPLRNWCRSTRPRSCHRCGPQRRQRPQRPRCSSVPASRSPRALIPPTMRHPLPYAFARTSQLLLEDDGHALTLWHHASQTPAPSAK